MKTLSSIRLKPWFMNKQETSWIAMSVNPAYTFTIEKETEKAIEIKVHCESRPLFCEFTKWLPKSVIENLEEVKA